MSLLSMEQTQQLVFAANSMSREQLQELQLARFRKIVAHAKENSPYLREKYSAVQKNPTLNDVPVSTRAELVARYNDWVIDPEVKQKDVQDFIANLENLGKPFLNRYVMMTTSGSAGAPLLVLRDSQHVAVNAALMMIRAMGGPCVQQLKGLNLFECKTAAIVANKGFHSSYLGVVKERTRLRALGKDESTLLYLPIDTPIDEMIEKLNAFQPDLIACYPSAMVMLAPAQQAGRLKISPKLITCSAEQLLPHARQILMETFGSVVFNNYCSTEGGEVAFSCPLGNMHVNIDWMIIEPVDKNNQPVAPGETSDGILLTNLANYVQPIIRYRVSDQIVWHDEPCQCRQATPYIEFKWRAEEILTFASGDKPVAILPRALFLCGLDTDGCSGVQCIQRTPNKLEIRWEVKHGFDKQSVGEKIRNNLQNIMKSNGLEVAIILVDEPFTRSKGGKFLAAYKDFS